MAKQAIKKGAGIKKVGLAAFKEKKGMSYNPKSSESSEVSNANKPQQWYVMSDAISNALKINGLPYNTVCGVCGNSNVGKSTFVNDAFVAAVRQGACVVYFDTENAFSFQYAKQMGLKAEPIYGDVEVETVNPDTGEVTVSIENRIVDWEGNFLYYNNAKLAEQYGQWDYKQGKEVSKKRKRAVIEDIAMCINEILDAQDDGEIDQDILFIWDSVGSIGCYKEVDAKGIGNPMWTAAAISAAFNSIVNERIPSHKKVSSKYNATLLYINKIWNDSMTAPGASILRMKGGNALFYGSRLVLLMGKQLVSGVKRLTATAKGLTYNYGIETTIKTIKNHLDAPYNVTYEGNLVVSDIGFIRPDKLEEYKKTHIAEILKQLNDQSKDGTVVTENDVVFTESAEEE